MFNAGSDLEQRALRLMSSSQIEERELGLDFVVSHNLRGAHILKQAVELDAMIGQGRLLEPQARALTDLVSSYGTAAVDALISYSQEALRGESADYRRAANALACLVTVLYYGKVVWNEVQKNSALELLPLIVKQGGAHGNILVQMIAPDLIKCGFMQPACNRG